MYKGGESGFFFFFHFLADYIKILKCLEFRQRILLKIFKVFIFFFPFHFIFMT